MERNVSMAQKYRLGELLTRREMITPSQLDEALIYQQQFQLPIGQALIELGYISDSQVRHALFKQHWLRLIATVISLFMAPISYCHGERNNIEQLPEYSYTQVAQSPCSYQAVHPQYDVASNQQDFDVMEVTTAALWHVSQGGVGPQGLNHVPVQVHLTSEDIDDGLSLNLSVKF